MTQHDPFPPRPSSRARISGVLDMGWEAGESRSSLEAPVELTPQQRGLFDALYREHFDFVFRNLRRLGVAESAIDDGLQDVYLVALRRIGEFREGTHAKAWLFAIVLRVAGNLRRSQRRRGNREALLQLTEENVEAGTLGPFEQTAQQQARQILHAFLEQLDDNRRAAFVMSELEQMTAPEIAEALSANVNTVYSWVRAARVEFVRRLESLRKGEEARSG
jgi:RNA polymerase sigma-70 factor (ECF subfamily)